MERTSYNPEVNRYSETRKAIEKARAVRIFLSHFVAYVIGNAFLAVWNALTYYVKEDDTLWFYLPLLFCAILGDRRNHPLPSGRRALR